VGAQTPLGAREVRREVRLLEEMSNHLLSEIEVGLDEQAREVKLLRACPTACRLRRAQWGVGGGSMIAEGCSVITYGTWSEPVEGRGVFHEEMKGERAVFTKARSRRKASNCCQKESVCRPQGY